jgi:IS5 family transposase
VLTPGEAHETRAFAALVEDLAAGTRCLIGDAGYDADWVRQELLLRGVLPVIPPNPVRNEPAPLDRDLYRLRNRVERLVNSTHPAGAALRGRGDLGGSRLRLV